MAVPLLRRAVAAHIYVSEGKDHNFIDRLASVAVAAGAIVANKFLDEPYHRSGLTLSSSDDKKVEEGVAAVCREAFLALNLQTHTASHPRLGVVDHVACNPLGEATCEEAGALAISIGRRLGGGEHPAPTVPIYLYGAAREDARRLADLRRSLGYFSGAKQGEWTGLMPEVASAVKANAPDFGPQEVDPCIGVVTIGAVPWIHNYNLLVTSAALSQNELMACCRQIARSVSTRGGGPQAVETMALLHDRGVEVACNLLDSSVTPPEEVWNKVAALCAQEQVVLDSAYFTNKRPDDILRVVAEAGM